MAAETLAILTLANSGDEIVSTTSLYGGTYNLFHYTLPKLGIKVRFVDADDFEGLRKAINDRTQAPFTPNRSAIPSSMSSDMEKLASIAHEHGIPLIVDNTVPTPILCVPSSGARTSSSIPPPNSSAAMATALPASSSMPENSIGPKSGRFPDFVEPDPSYHGLS